MLTRRGIRPPRIRLRLPIRRNDVKSPNLLTISESKCSHPAARCPLRASWTDIDQITIDERGHADEVAVGGICNLLCPNEVAILRIDRNQEVIRRAANDLAIG